MSRRPPGIGSNAASVSGAAPTGAAGGDLSGTYPNPTVANLNGVAAASYALLASPTFTGTPTLPSGTVLTNITGIVGGLPKIIRRSTDATGITANTTPANDDTLLFAIGASDVWFFECILMINAANATMDVKFAWTVPASATMTWAGEGNGAVATAWGNLAAAGAPLALLTESSTASFGTAIGTTGHKLTGFVTGGGSAGNVNLKVAQATSDAGALVVKMNSLIRATRIA